jgi:hypothetical protein
MSKPFFVSNTNVWPSTLSNFIRPASFIEAKNLVEEDLQAFATISLVVCPKLWMMRSASFHFWRCLAIGLNLIARRASCKRSKPTLLGFGLTGSFVCVFIMSSLVVTKKSMFELNRRRTFTKTPRGGVLFMTCFVTLQRLGACALR